MVHYWDGMRVFLYCFKIHLFGKVRFKTSKRDNFAKVPKWVITNNNGVLQRSEKLPFQVKSE
jgi:hypothetical protein